MAVPTNILVTRERCAMCNKISRLGFWVPDEIWKAAVHTYRQNDILCFDCFTVGADEKLIPWDEAIKLFPVSFVTHLREATK